MDREKKVTAEIVATSLVPPRYRHVNGGWQTDDAADHRAAEIVDRPGGDEVAVGAGVVFDDLQRALSGSLFGG